VGWNRLDFPWDEYEPTQGHYNDQILQQYGQDILAMRASGAELLPCIGYNTLWSSEIPGDKFAPLAANHVADWTEMITRVVTFLHAPPYNVQYFQLWNEAHPKSGFWNGDLDTYMDRVHIPGAKAVRDAGGKVVYGGWPVVDLQDYIPLLNKHNAWPTLDVLDMHYYNGTRDFDVLYDGAVAAGYPNIGIWNTEVGWENTAGFIDRVYPPLLCWAWRHNWSYPDKFKIFYYNDEGGGESSLHTGHGLSRHGAALKVMAAQVNARGIQAYCAGH
jgi:hypothetical protein